MQLGISAHIRSNYIFREESGPLHGRIGIWKWWFSEHFVFLGKAAVRDKHGKGPGTEMTFLWGLPTSSPTALPLLRPQHTRACSQGIVLWNVCQLATPLILV